jgi:peptidoglycan/LPS O-acetylase OafA/YrhL
VLAPLQKVAESLESPQILDVEQPARRRPLHALTTLRFVAAMYVVLFHCEIKDLFPNAILIRHFFQSGYTGVSLFFVLSGFILTYNYPVVTDRVKFWISRFARVYPVYLLAMLAALPAVVLRLEGLHNLRLWVSIPESLLLLQSWDPQTAFLINSPSWTLSVEALFYAVFPFLLPVVTRASRWAVTAFIACSLVVALIPAIATGSSREWWTTVFMGALPVLRIGPFVVGIVAGIRYRREGSGREMALWVGLAASILLLVLYPPHYLSPARDAILSVTFAALVYGLADVKWVVLTHPFALLLGEISFGIYILQQPVGWAMRVLSQALIHRNLTENTPIYVFVLLVASYLSYRFVEMPCRIWIRQFS